MATSNPKTAIDAILDSGKKQSGILGNMYPLTIARYALLDLVDSPFVKKGKVEFDNLLVSLYIMCQEAKELSKYNSHNIEKIKEDAFTWSENISPDELSGLVSRLVENLNQMVLLMPENVQNPKKKASD